MDSSRKSYQSFSGETGKGVSPRIWRRSTLKARSVIRFSRTRRQSVRPTMSASLLKPRSAMICRSCMAIKVMKRTTCSGFPLKRQRSLSFWVAMPTGQVSLEQTRIIIQPMVTRGAVAKPYSSAPRRAAMATSRPLMSLPSVSRTTRLRRPFSTRQRWASDRPSSQGSPALWMELPGAAPVPPS